MKVIQEGKEGGLWSPQVTCTGAGNGNAGCGALLEISAPDLFHTAHFDYGGGSEHYVTFECPCCKSWNDVNERKTHLPSALHSKIMNEPHRVPRKEKSKSSSSDPF